MKTKFIQTLYALLLPLSFIGILIILNSIPMIPLGRYEFGGIVLSGVSILLTFLALKKDKKTFKDIGFQWEKKTPIRFIIGFLIGVLITALMLFIVINFSNLELSYNPDSKVFLVLFWLLVFFPLAYMEEIIFRGYAFIKINKTIGLWPAQILLAILFTWYHDFTGLTFFNQLLGPGVWALIYGISAVWSKGLAFPTGLHMAINVILALVSQKDGRHAIWNIEYATDANPMQIAQSENIGMMLQIGILVIAIILTEYYRRNQLKISQK